MRTLFIALATLLCAASASAQDPLGDDSGPKANDGACDDSRFENIGPGNSNVIQWEGGRYDRRDASDCRNLLLQGLINWRDGVDPGVPAALATGQFGDDSGPNANDGRCDDGRFENIGAGNSNVVFWEGARYDGRDATDCADLLLRGLIAWRRDGSDREAEHRSARSSQPAGPPDGASTVYENTREHLSEGIACTQASGDVRGEAVRACGADLEQTLYVFGCPNGTLDFCEKDACDCVQTKFGWPTSFQCTVTWRCRVPGE